MALSAPCRLELTTNAASDTVYGGWKDSEMRAWLIENGYMRSDAQVKRDELVALMASKYVIDPSAPHQV